MKMSRSLADPCARSVTATNVLAHDFPEARLINLGNSTSTSFGDLLRDWRARRRWSQLDLAAEAGVSQRHVSFIESGRATPSREMIITLADQLAIPLRERNRLLLAAGLAPVYEQRSLDDSALAAIRASLERLLSAHDPYPAFAVSSRWTLIAHNSATAGLMTLITDASLLDPPVNVLRLVFHPAGLAPLVQNLGEWRRHMLRTLEAGYAASGDAELDRLRQEIRNYPLPPESQAQRHAKTEGHAIAIPLILKIGGKCLSLISARTVFDSPLDITLSEIALETFLPGDAATAEALHRMAGERSAAVERDSPTVG
jgi:transcriptional regulator with XRE-family HTH domain